MKQLLTLIVGLGFAVWGTGVANANELSNGDLNIRSVSSQVGATPTNWIVEASTPLSNPFNDGAASEAFANANAADPGGAFGLFFKPFQGADPDNKITVHLYQDNPGTPGRVYTLTGWAGAEQNYSGLNPDSGTVSEFAIDFDNDTNPANGVLNSATLDLRVAGLGSSGESFGYAQYTVMAAAPAGTVSVRVRASMIDAFNTSGQQAFVVDFFDLTSAAPPGSPVITNHPIHQTVSPGTNVTFTVGVSNTAGVSYQWQLNGTNLVNGGGISGATSQTLTITGVSTNRVGHYRVRVSNTTGTVFSEEATLALVGIAFYPTVTIVGKIGDTYRVDYATALSPTTWIPLSTNLLTSSPQFVVDSSSPNSNNRFYRAVYLLP